ncbi:MAG: ATP-binding cassette domain-containing protein, partial [Anaerolineales bacterium]|nr:ATP-binding cassette domain-containing protein [Anaerolineales bacterium]
MIVTQDLSKQFGDYWAVNKVNLNIQQGEVLALLGPNGAGKTTTIRILTSVLRPTKGRAWIAGYDVVKEPKKVRAAVGVLTEQHGLYGRMPAIDYLDFFGQ